VATLYLDESKAKNYVFIGVLVQDGDAPRLRKRVAALKMPGQRSIHFVKEAESRRRKLIHEISDLGFAAVRFESKDKSQKKARELCIREIVKFAANQGIRSLVFERDESAVINDEKWLKEAILKTQGIDKLGFVHLHRFEEPLLWVADAIAWCDTRGGDWANRVNESIKIRIETYV
jgi:hypothetical protein